jgi:signal transduction histidine kinase
MSHELRTPLTSVLCYTELLLSGEAGELSARQRVMIDAVDRNAQRLLKIVEDLVQLHDGSSYLTGHRSEEALSHIAADALATHRSQVTGRNLDVTLHVGDSDVLVLVDRSRVQQAISNLVSNAVKFTPGGGSVRLDVGREGARAVVRVSDTGVGIPSDEVPLVFERFFRSSVSRRHATQGVGIGLSIAQAIILSCDGTIDLSSVEGQGTIATISLPALNSSPDAGR